MKTRTLILWSLVCGVIILIAGSIKLFQVSSEDATVEFLAFGESVTVSDMVVAVESLDASGASTLVTVTMSGPEG
jgi:VCBS repeat-containing protein